MAIGVLQGGGALAHVYGSPRYALDLDFEFEGRPFGFPAIPARTA